MAKASFLLVVTVVLPVYTGLSEVLRRKIPLCVAFFLFATGSVIFATAQSLAVLILARALRGSGCGGIDILNEILVAYITTLRERTFYVGLVSIPFALWSVIGPVMGAAGRVCVLAMDRLDKPVACRSLSSAGLRS